MRSRAVRFASAGRGFLLLAAVHGRRGRSWVCQQRKNPTCRGVRIPVMSLDSELKADATLAANADPVAPPYRNPEWPRRGLASNAMYIWRRPAACAKCGAGRRQGQRPSIPISPPAVVAGSDLCSGFRGACFCLPAGDGHPVWDAADTQERHRLAHHLGSLGKRNTIDPPQGMGGGVTYDDGKIFVTSASA